MTNNNSFYYGIPEKQNLSILILPDPDEEETSSSETSNSTIIATTDLHDNWKIPFQVQGITIVLLNFILFVFILKYINRLRSKHITRCFMNLQVAHICFGALLFLGQMIAPRIITIVSATILLQMFFSMLLKTIDQYLFIQFPYKYDHVTSRDVMKMILLTWLISLTFALVSLFGVTLTNFSLTVILTFIMAISMLVLGVCNFSIFLIAQRHYLFIKKQNKKYSHKKVSPRKPLLTCLIIVLTFCLSWLPYLIHNTLVLGNIYKAGRLDLFSQIVLFVAGLNAIADPIVFVWFNRDLKKEMLKLHRTSMRSFRKRSSNDEKDDVDTNDRLFLQTESSMI